MSSKLSDHFPTLGSKIMDERVWSLMTAVPLWYNPVAKPRIIPDDLKPFMVGRHFLSTKQVPSGLILAKAGSASISKNQSHLYKRGFTIEEVTWDEDGNPSYVTRQGIGKDEVPRYSESLSTLLRDASEHMEVHTRYEGPYEDESDSSGSEASDADGLLDEKTVGDIRRRKTIHRRIKYEDPWKIHAAHALANVMDIEGPTLVTWSGDGIRLQDPLPPRILGPSWEGSLRNKIRFHKIAAEDVKRYVIYRHTHWGRRLSKECADPKSPIRHWAVTLKTRINRFLSGKADPIWTTDEKQLIAPDGYKTRDRGARALRLIELLKTADGVFTQRFLANPAEVWTWERFDMFMLGTISLLLGDEFLDGELPIGTIAIRTSYAVLKWTRKWFKQSSHRGMLKEDQPPPEGGRWARLLWRTWNVLDKATGHERLLIIGVLSQTRGCGTPPPLVVLQSKRKFLETVSLEPPEESATMRTLRGLAIKEVINDLPVAAVTGLGTKSRVTITSAACWEKTRREGGTTEMIKTIITSFDPSRQVRTIDLETGRVNRWMFPDEFDSVGELIFWLCLNQVLRTPPEGLKQAFLTVVKEPGKARSVTKARACLKVVLDLVSKICAEPLAKGVRSSQSGMTASNHGWNLFNSFHNEIERQEVFHVLKREETPFEGYVEVTDTFADLFVSSTDYKEATDSLRHDVARDLGNAWMIKCGIPAVLRGIVNKTCYEPREIFFKATGLLEDLGDASPQHGENIRSVFLRQGVLMGDPLTKPVLHLVNVCTRHLENRLMEPSFYVGLPNFHEISEVLERVKNKLGRLDLSRSTI